MSYPNFDHLLLNLSTRPQAPASDLVVLASRQPWLAADAHAVAAKATRKHPLHYVAISDLTELHIYIQKRGDEACHLQFTVETVETQQADAVVLRKYRLSISG